MLGHEVVPMTCKVKGIDVAWDDRGNLDCRPDVDGMDEAGAPAFAGQEISIMKSMWFLAAFAATTSALPAVAEAATAFATANVNMRSGPSTRYPAVVVIPAGARVDIRGCLSGANWCDVAAAGYRGWVSGSYLQTTYSQRRVYVDPQYYRPLGIPTVTFSIGRYWDDHYRGRPFYRDRDRWRDGDWREERRDRDRDRRADNDRRGRDDDRRVRREVEPQDDKDRHPLRRIIQQQRCERDPRACR